MIFMFVQAVPGNPSLKNVREIFAIGLRGLSDESLESSLMRTCYVIDNSSVANKGRQVMRGC